MVRPVSQGWQQSGLSITEDEKVNRDEQASKGHMRRNKQKNKNREMD